MPRSAIDLDEVGITYLAELLDRAAAVVVVADARDEPRPAAGQAEVPGDVRRRAAELVSVGEPVPQDFTPDDDGLVATN